MASKKIQLYTDRANTIEASPETSANCVILSDGNDLQKVLDNDLTNPTVVHEETSFKVGVGDIDVSGSVVDGEVGRMVIKGQTYQNILPEPSLRNSMTNGKTMQKLNEGYDSVNTVDGVCKSAILKGQTLVNLAPNDTFEGSATNRGQEFTLAQPVQPNKQYILLVNITKDDTVGGWHCRFTDGVNYPVFQASIKGVGLKKVVFTTSIALSKFFPYFELEDCEQGRYITMENVMLLEYQQGMENWDIPYFEGMQSVKMPVLCTTGKNLFDSSTEIVTGQGINSTNGLPYNISSHSCTGFLRVKSNTTYTITQSHNRTWVFAYNKNKEYIKVVKTDILSGGNFTTPNDTYYIRLDFNTANTSEIVNGVQIEEGSTATSYEPYKTNILHTPEEVVLRSLPNGVKDTLNLMTGEYVKRIGEIVLDGTQNWTLKTGNWEFENTFGFITTISDMINTTQSHPAHSNGNSLVCSHFPSYGGNSLSNNALPNDIEMVGIDLNRVLGLRITKTKLSTPNAEGLKAWLQANPVTVQYELQTPTIKTVDLSTSGNWEKVVLDGSENWLMTNNTHFYTKLSNELSPNALLPIIDNSLFTPKDNSNSTANAVWYGGNVGDKNGNIVFNVLDKTLEQFKQYLSQNPITVWYQTTNHKDSTQVKQPIFFKDGHVQLSSGADNSLIPTLDYQAKTSNSYVMDLMKTNTKYTMKAKSASGTFTIDGTQYNFNTNGTFTTPSTMNNKLMIANGTVTDLMFIEGDVTSKTIPYFKGIKSAFEGEDKIEVLSTSQNILDTSKIVQGDLLGGGIIGATGGSADSWCYTVDYIPCPSIKQELHAYRTVDGKYSSTTTFIYFFNDSKQLLGSRVQNTAFKIPVGAKYMRIMVHKGDMSVDRIGIMVTNSNKDRIDQSIGGLQNNTKIPLLSPLRSLPNGVCDELIIDRMKKKATLIQRVGVGVLDGTQSMTMVNSSVDTSLYQPFFCGDVFGNMAVVPRDVVVVRCDKLLANFQTPAYRNLTVNAIYQYTDSSARLAGQITRKDLGVKGVNDWFRANPTTVYYQLATPVVTEIDLENFPLVYKDGHIFLNSEIAPVVEIDYNVNQTQQIQANNETLQRHELDILDLDNLIVSFVNAEYNLRLLKFNMELSMMALAE